MCNTELSPSPRFRTAWLELHPLPPLRLPRRAQSPLQMMPMEANKRSMEPDILLKSVSTSEHVTHSKVPTQKSQYGVLHTPCRETVINAKKKQKARKLPPDVEELPNDAL